MPKPKPKPTPAAQPEPPLFSEDELDAIHAALKKAKLDSKLILLVIKVLTHPGVTFEKQ